MADTYRIIQIDLSAPLGVKTAKVLGSKLDHEGAVEAITALRKKRLPGSRFVAAVVPEAPRG